MDDAIICVEEVVRTFGQVVALGGVSFQVKRGEVFGYIGPNGAGKTTTVRILLGLCRPTSGLVTIFGQHVSKEFGEIGPRVGVVLEHHGLHEELTGAENLDFYGRLFGLPAAARQRQIGSLLELAGLQNRAHSRVKTYSKGMKQRLAFARSLINEPELLVLDEPFDGIDTETRRHLRDLVLQLSQERQLGIFLTSHLLDDVEKLATRVAVIRQGKLLTCDTVENLKRLHDRNSVTIRFGTLVKPDALRQALSPLGLADSFILDGEHATVFLNDSVGVGDLVDRLVSVHIRVQEIKRTDVSLEDTYFKLLTVREETSGAFEHSTGSGAYRIP